MLNITYLIGAGASCNVLPTVKDLPSRLESLCGNFAFDWAKPVNDSFTVRQETHEPFSVVKEKFINDIKWLYSETLKHSSIDTFARKLYLTGRIQELIKLKILLNEFFIIEQLFRGIDLRYDAFFATVLSGGGNRDIELPGNIKIISWNYDRQVEFSIGQFVRSLHPKSINHDSLLENIMQIYPGRNSRELNDNRFCLVKLNGSFGGSLHEDLSYTQMPYNVNIMGTKLNNEQRFGILERSLIRYSNNLENSLLKETPKYEPSIYYAWEEKQPVKQIREIALKVAESTDILVVIGYSFPVFNRNIDRQLLMVMNKLQKIYIQNTPQGMGGVVQRISSMGNFNPSIISPIDSTDEFYIPNEFD
jgi:hypothetical protein